MSLHNRFIVIVPRTLALFTGLAAFAVAFGTSATLVQASPEQFPRYAELQPNIAFWSDVFGRYGSDEVIFHDPYRLDVVYRVGDISHIMKPNAGDAVNYRAIREYISKENDRIGASIRHLAHSAPRTESEKRIATELK